MNVLLIDQNKESREMIGFAIETQLGAVIHYVPTFQAALEYLIGDNPLDLIVCENVADTTKLFKYLLSVGADIPCILINPDTKPRPPVFPELVVAHVDPPDVISRLIEVIQKAKSENKIQSQTDSGFCRIKTELLIKVVPLQADIYIKLSEIKYVKLFRQGDVFDTSDLSKYLVDRHIEYLYLKKEETNLFLVKFKKALAEVLLQQKICPPEIPILAESIHEMVTELSGMLGFTPEIQELVSENVKTVIQGTRKQPKLARIFDHMNQNPKKYIPAHSVMAAHVSCHIAMKLQWFSNMTLEKLTYASFLHDITLKNVKIAMIDNLDELEGVRSGFTEEELKSYLNHPVDAVTICQQFHEIPGDVDSIILQHHERHDKSGFPRKLPMSRIAPLATVFIVAHDLVDRFLKQQKPEDFLGEMAKKYKHGNFRKIMQAISPEDFSEEGETETHSVSSAQNSNESESKNVECDPPQNPVTVLSEKKKPPGSGTQGWAARGRWEK